MSSHIRWDKDEQKNFALALAMQNVLDEVSGKKRSFQKRATIAQKEAILPHRRKTLFQETMMLWLPARLVEARDKLRGDHISGTVTTQSIKEDKALAGMDTLERLETRIVRSTRQMEDLHLLVMEVLTSNAVEKKAFSVDVAQAAKTFERHSVALIGLKGDKEPEIRKAYDGMHKLHFVHSRKGHVDVEHMPGVQYIFSIRGLNDQARQLVEQRTGRKIQFVESMDELRQRLNSLAVQRT